MLLQKGRTWTHEPISESESFIAIVSEHNSD